MSVSAMHIETVQDLVVLNTGDWNWNGNCVRIIIVDLHLNMEKDMVELLVKLCNSGYYWLQVRWIPMYK